MKPETDDFHMNELERGLRHMADGHRPAAPATIHDFIDRVALEHPRVQSRWFGSMPPARRWRLAAAGLGAALVLAVGASALLLSVRPDMNPAASALPSGFDFETGGWAWKLVGDPAPAAIGRVANGWVGECVSGGNPAVCTSKDAVHWSLPPDPSIFALDNGGTFGGWSIAHGSGGWVAAGTVTAGLWHSSDGVRWSAVSSGVTDLKPGQVVVLGGGFVVVERSQQTGVAVKRLLVSDDGLAWRVRVPPVEIVNPVVSGSTGLSAETTVDAAGKTVFVASADGTSWSGLTLPAGVFALTSTVRLDSGSYLGLGVGRTPALPPQLLVSADGVAWRVSSALSPEVDSLAEVGGRVLAVFRIPNTETRALADSTDGNTWRQIATMGTGPLDATAVAAVGGELGLFDGSKLAAIGIPVAATGPSAAPSRSGVPVAGPSALPSAVIVGGWRWHRLNIVPDSPVVRLPNGYLAHCKDSMCTSRDGWTWQYGADPAVFSLDSNDVFTPGQYAHGPDGGYVITDGAGVWHSADGVHFSRSKAPLPTFSQTGLGSYVGLAAGPNGYTLVGLGYWDSTGLRGRLYTSSDGVSWTDVGLTYYLGLNLQGSGAAETSGGLLASRSSARPGQYLYSADGRHWVSASVPANSFPESVPSRLPNGTLFVQSAVGPLRSTDGGRAWSKVSNAGGGYGVAVVGNRVLIDGLAADGNSTVKESDDAGATFHSLLSGGVGQFGDMAAVRVAGPTVWVGSPLAASELPATTPTATGLPAATPSPSPTAQPTPAGGISRDTAIGIARGVAHPLTEEFTLVATVVFDDRYQRWIWMVDFVRGASPTGDQGTVVYIDYFSGEVLGSGNWIS